MDSIPHRKDAKGAKERHDSRSAWSIGCEYGRPGSLGALRVFAVNHMPHAKSGVLAQRRLALLIGLPLVASVLGACLLRVIPSRAMPTVITVAMIVVAAFSLLKRKTGSASREEPSRASTVAGYVLTFSSGPTAVFSVGGMLRY